MLHVWPHYCNGPFFLVVWIWWPIGSFLLVVWIRWPIGSFDWQATLSEAPIDSMQSWKGMQHCLVALCIAATDQWLVFTQGLSRTRQQCDWQLLTGTNDANLIVFGSHAGYCVTLKVVSRDFCQACHEQQRHHAMQFAFGSGFHHRPKSPHQHNTDSVQWSCRINFAAILTVISMRLQVQKANENGNRHCSCSKEAVCSQ